MKLAVILGSGITLVSTAAASEFQTLAKRDGQANSRMINAPCSNIQETRLSCVKGDENWPLQGFQCGETEVDMTLMNSIADGLARQPPHVRTESTPPPDLKTACGSNGDKIYSYSHGSVWVYYSLNSDCRCNDKTVVPKCEGANAASEEACNFTRMVYCGAMVLGKPCPVTSPN